MGKEKTSAGSIKTIQGWTDCFPRCELKATVFDGGVNYIGDIKGHPALEEAYKTGMEV